MTADYVISRINNGYILTCEGATLYFSRLHDLLTWIKDEELTQDYADQAIDASFSCEAGTCQEEDHGA